MPGRALPLVLVILGLTPWAAAESRPKVTLVKAGRLLDARSGRYLEQQAVLVEGERIKEVGPTAAVASRTPDAIVVDLGAATLLPGLVDCHAHLLSSMRPELGAGENILLTVAGMSPAARALMGAANARETLEAGITTVRNVGHSGVDGDVALRDAINQGWVSGPRVLAAARKLTPPGGQALALRHELAGPVSDLEFLAVNGVAQARSAVREALLAGAEMIKVVVDVPPRLLAADEVKAIVDEAHRSGVKVAAHATTRDGVRIAVDAGVDSIEHADELDDSALQAMAARGIFLGATDWSAGLIRDLFMKTRRLSAEEEAGWELEIRKWVESARDRMVRARKAGVRFVMASDMWYRFPGLTRGQAALRVLEGLQDEGVPKAEILRAATVNGAELVGWVDRIGALEAGKFADVVALDGDPLADVRELQKIRFVMKGGVVVRNDPPR